MNSEMTAFRLLKILRRMTKDTLGTMEKMQIPIAITSDLEEEMMTLQTSIQSV